MVTKEFTSLSEMLDFLAFARLHGVQVIATRYSCLTAWVAI